MNETIDIYKTIHVAADETDYDGDGIKNSADSCTTVENSNQDYDQDGIDDACDGFIAEPPPAPAITQPTGEPPEPTPPIQQSIDLPTPGSSYQSGETPTQLTGEAIQPTVPTDTLQSTESAAIQASSETAQQITISKAPQSPTGVTLGTEDSYLTIGDQTKRSVLSENAGIPTPEGTNINSSSTKYRFSMVPKFGVLSLSLIFGVLTVIIVRLMRNWRLI